MKYKLMTLNKWNEIKRNKYKLIKMASKIVD